MAGTLTEFPYCDSCTNKVCTNAVKCSFAQKDQSFNCSITSPLQTDSLSVCISVSSPSYHSVQIPPHRFSHHTLLDSSSVPPMTLRFLTVFCLLFACFSAQKIIKLVSLKGENVENAINVPPPYDLYVSANSDDSSLLKRIFVKTQDNSIAS